MYYYTALRKLTPHHNTGARLVAQSNVKRLISHITTSTGTGASSTSVLLRKGRAVINKVSKGIPGEIARPRTLIPVESDYEVVAQSQQVHCVAKEIRDPVVPRDEWHEQELEYVEEDPDGEEGADGDLEASLSAGVRIHDFYVQSGMSRYHVHQSNTRTPVLPLQHHSRSKDRRALVFSSRARGQRGSTSPLR